MKDKNEYIKVYIIIYIYRYITTSYLYFAVNTYICTYRLNMFIEKYVIYYYPILCSIITNIYATNILKRIVF